MHMITYRYTVGYGIRVATIQATSLDSARMQLAAMGIFPITLIEAPRRRHWMTKDEWEDWQATPHDWGQQAFLDAYGV